MLRDEWWWLRNGRCQEFLNFLAWAPQRVMLLAERRGKIDSILHVLALGHPGGGIQKKVAQLVWSLGERKEGD